MTTIHEIILFVQVKTGSIDVRFDSDITSDLGIYGDDFDELLSDYSNRYEVNMDSYLWYFHSREEGLNLGGLFFEPPNKRVERIPVTPEMLLEFARNGTWDIQYPEHKLPKNRPDMIFNRILGIVMLTGLTVLLIMKYSK